MLDEPLAEVGRPREGEEKADNVSNTDFGNEATYTRRRLLRDRPDLYERVVTGELSASSNRRRARRGGP